MTANASLAPALTCAPFTRWCLGTARSRCRCCGSSCATGSSIRRRGADGFTQGVLDPTIGLEKRFRIRAPRVGDRHRFCIVEQAEEMSLAAKGGKGRREPGIICGVKQENGIGPLKSFLRQQPGLMTRKADAQLGCGALGLWRAAASLSSVETKGTERGAAVQHRSSERLCEGASTDIALANKQHRFGSPEGAASSPARPSQQRRAC